MPLLHFSGVACTRAGDFNIISGDFSTSPFLARFKENMDTPSESKKDSPLCGVFFDQVEINYN